MEVLSLCPFRAGALLWQAARGAFSLTIIVKATFDIVPGGEATLAEAQVPVTTLAEGGAEDLSPLKPRVDVLAVNAGEDARIEIAGSVLPARGPMPPEAPSRRLMLGDEAFDWASAVLAGAAAALGPPPEGFDFSFFQSAPRDQRIDLLRSAASIGMDRVLSMPGRIETRLPSRRPQAFRVDPKGGRVTEIALRCDTICIDAAAKTLILTFRGLCDLKDGDADNVGKIVVASHPDGKKIRAERIDRFLRLGTSLEEDAGDGVSPLEMRHDAVLIAPKSGDTMALPESSSVPVPPPAPAPSEREPRQRSRTFQLPEDASAAGLLRSPTGVLPFRPVDPDAPRPPPPPPTSLLAKAASTMSVGSDTLVISPNRPMAPSTPFGEASKPRPEPPPPPPLPPAGIFPPPPALLPVLPSPEPPAEPAPPAPPPLLGPIVPEDDPTQEDPPPSEPRIEDPFTEETTLDLPPKALRLGISPPAADAEQETPPAAPPRPGIAPPRPGSVPPRPGGISPRLGGKPPLKIPPPLGPRLGKPAGPPRPSTPPPRPATVAPPRPAAPEPEPAPAPDPASPPFDPASAMPLDKCASTAAEMRHCPDKRANILRAAGLTEEQWTAVERHHAEAISRETERGQRKLLVAYDAAYVATQERLGLRVGLAEHARLQVAAERGTTGSVLAELGLEASDQMRLGRVWTQRLVDDATLMPKLSAAIEAERAR